MNPKIATLCFTIMVKPCLEVFGSVWRCSDGENGIVQGVRQLSPAGRMLILGDFSLSLRAAEEVVVQALQ